jgi:AraC family transcriptional regulator, activator of mtrCDE
MDLLSQLLALMPVAGRLDVRCHFGAPWRIEEPAAQAREIPYHVLLRGEAVIEDEHGEPLRMTAGDIVLFPAGTPHVLHDGSGSAALAASARQVNGLTVVTNEGANEGKDEGTSKDKSASADILCGRFLLPAVPERLLRDHLPGRLLVHSVAARNDAHAAQRDGEFAGSRLARLIQLMREEALEQGPASETLVNHLSGALFALTLRFASHADEAPRGLLTLAQRPRLQPALAAMFDEPARPWTLPELAELCYMSRATFARHFDEAIGRSASDVLTEIRMALAGRKLAQTSLAIAEIGEAVGYQSDAAFQRVFKRQVGMTPAQWRARAKAEALPKTPA